ncbi:MAG: hypothetical protein ACFFCS_13680 [Candidatus Hodarchaeota archaeon]
MKINKKKAGLAFFLLFFLSIWMIGSLDFQFNEQPASNTELKIGVNIEHSQWSESFNILKQNTTVWVEYDCSLTIEYNITFENKDYWDDITVVDIGFPTNEYNLAGVKAWYIDGAGVEHVLNDIRKSEAIDVGVEVWLYPYDIGYNNIGTIRVRGNNPGMLYTDTQDNSKASLNFIPTWFDSDYLYDDYVDNYNVTFYFPENQVDGNQCKYHQFSGDYWKAPDNMGLQNFSGNTSQRLYYNWYYSSIYTGSYKFGASFPKDWVDASKVKADPALVMGIWIGLSVFGGLTVLFSVIFLAVEAKKKREKTYYPPTRKKAPKMTGGCACIFWIAIVLIVIFIQDISLLIFGVSLGLIISGFAFIAFFIGRGLNKKLKYEKPKLSIECVGVNKNLTVPESAIIKNTQLGKVVFLVIFGLLRKGVIGIKSIDPIVFEIKQKIYPANLKKLDEKGRKIRNYELDFYEAIDKVSGKIVETKLKTMLIKMIKVTHKKMVGFDLKASIAYHDNLMRKAWTQIRNTKGDIKFEDIEKEFEYIMLDENYEGKAKMVFHGRRIYTPYWYHSYYWHRTSPGVGASVPIGAGRTGSMMGALNFANSLSTGLSNISSGIVNNVSNFFNSIVNTVSPPAPKSTGGGLGGGRSYGGSSCACACACACAGCACACAGGGR